MEPIEGVLRRTPASYAVVETVPNGRRVLCLTDDDTDAHEIAFELRRRGIQAAACRVREEQQATRRPLQSSTDETELSRPRQVATG
jgi:precorrin-6B methylase 1